MLLRLVQTGQYNLPGGTFVRDSTMSSIRTRNELPRVEQQEERSQDEVDKTSTDNQIVAMNQESNPEANIAEQNLNSCKASMKELQHREIANQQAIGNQREEEEDNTNQRVFFISVQTQSPTKQGRKEQRRRREQRKQRWKSSSQASFSSSQPSLPESCSATENSLSL